MMIFELCLCPVLDFVVPFYANWNLRLNTKVDFAEFKFTCS